MELFYELIHFSFRTEDGLQCSRLDLLKEQTSVGGEI